MLNNIFKQIIHKVAWKVKKNTIVQILPSRCRRDGMPEYGRFTPKDIKQIILQTEQNIKELMPYIIDFNNTGNYQNEYVGLVDLAIYRSLIKVNIDSIYAMKLVADMMWQAVANSKGLIPIIDPIRKYLLKLITKSPMKYLEKRLKEMIKYPYSEPGYRMKFYKVNQVFCMDIHSCPVYDFYKQFGNEEMKLFRKTWCTFDYTAAEHVVESGKYEREHTLSDGDNVCDMRWSIKI